MKCKQTTKFYNDCFNFTPTTMRKFVNSKQAAMFINKNHANNPNIIDYSVTHHGSKLSPNSFYEIRHVEVRADDFAFSTKQNQPIIEKSFTMHYETTRIRKNKDFSSINSPTRLTVPIHAVERYVERSGNEPKQLFKEINDNNMQLLLPLHVMKTDDLVPFAIAINSGLLLGTLIRCQPNKASVITIKNGNIKESDSFTVLTTNIAINIRTFISISDMFPEQKQLHKILLCGRSDKVDDILFNCNRDISNDLINGLKKFVEMANYQSLKLKYDYITNIALAA